MDLLPLRNVSFARACFKYNAYHLLQDICQKRQYRRTGQIRYRDNL